VLCRPLWQWGDAVHAPPSGFGWEFCHVLAGSLSRSGLRFSCAPRPRCRLAVLAGACRSCRARFPCARRRRPSPRPERRRRQDLAVPAAVRAQTLSRALLGIAACARPELAERCRACQACGRDLLARSAGLRCHGQAAILFQRAAGPRASAEAARAFHRSLSNHRGGAKCGDAAPARAREAAARPCGDGAQAGIGRERRGRPATRIRVTRFAVGRPNLALCLSNSARAGGAPRRIRAHLASGSVAPAASSAGQTGRRHAAFLCHCVGAAPACVIGLLSASKSGTP